VASTPNTEPAVFLDRDNTLIANDGDLGDPALVRLLDGVAEGLHALRDAGYRLVVVSNQGGVARGVFTEHDVDAVNDRLNALAGDVIDRFYFCPHHPEAAIEKYRGEHPWRKPQPGMILQAAHDLNLDLARSWVIGDQERDIIAGHAAGCRTVLIGGESHEVKPTIAAANFTEAVERILQTTGGGGE
jgi:histidinol-phosphate phosphatase family protein